MIFVIGVLAFPPALSTATAAPHGVERKTVAAMKKAAAIRYGIDMRGFALDNLVLKSGQTFSTLLRSYGMPMPEILHAAKQSRPVFDTRRMVAGRSACVVRDPARGMSVRYFIYERADDACVVFDFGPPLAVRNRPSPQVRTRQVAAGGTITRSLWHTVKSQGLPLGLVDTLADLFAGTVDLRRFSKGDSFHVLYEEIPSNGSRPPGIGDIKAAVVTRGGKRHQAFRFTQGGTSGYYDETGANLKNAFLPAPLTYTSVTSGFSNRRLHPVKGIWRPHPAIDYAAPTGTPVMSVGDGVVEQVGYDETTGKYVRIAHPGSYISQYAHLSAVAPGVRKNARVAKGDVIGRVGSTGLATGPHLDFRFIKNDRYLDYTKMTLPDGQPLQGDVKNRFFRQVARLRSRLFAVVAERTAMEILDPPERTNLARSPWDGNLGPVGLPIR